MMPASEDLCLSCPRPRAIHCQNCGECDPAPSADPKTATPDALHEALQGFRQSLIDDSWIEYVEKRSYSPPLYEPGGQVVGLASTLEELDKIIAAFSAQPAATREWETFSDGDGEVGIRRREPAAPQLSVEQLVDAYKYAVASIHGSLDEAEYIDIATAMARRLGLDAQRFHHEVSARQDALAGEQA